MGEFDRQLQAFFRGANQIRHATESAVFWFRSVNRYAIAGDTTGEGELNSFMDSLYEHREM
ncbi:MAG: hypothetical protein NT013_20780, partial [Planctomycetia bacterium]|nr:hypothetical protein [Planctomycetia bacterium]